MANLYFWRKKKIKPQKFKTFYKGPSNLKKMICCETQKTAKTKPQTPVA